MSGRTIRAAMNEIFDFASTPASYYGAILIRFGGQHELIHISADIVGGAI